MLAMIEAFKQVKITCVRIRG